MSPGGRGAPPSWYQLRLVVPAEDVDDRSGALWAAGVAGVEERPAGPDRTLLVVSFQATALDEVVAAAGPTACEPVPAPSGAAGPGRPGPIGPVRVGRVAVVGAGDDEAGRPLVGPEVVRVRIDAAGAFGWGGHVTTRLALALLQEHLAPHDRVLDIGTGTGVLAVAAARLGAAGVVAVDTDPVAVASCRRNVAVNAVADRVQVRDGSVAHARGTFDVVVANLDRPTLSALAPSTRARLHAGSRLVVSGVLVEHEPGLVEAFALDVVDRVTEDGWVAWVATPARVAGSAGVGSAG